MGAQKHVTARGAGVDMLKVKKIEAIIKPYRLEAVKEALVEIGVEGRGNRRWEDIRDARGGRGTDSQ